MDKSKELSLLRQFFIAAIVIGTFAGGTAAFNYVFRDGLPPFPRLWSPQTSEIILTTIGVLIIGAMLAGFAVSAFWWLKENGVETILKTIGVLIAAIGAVGFIVVAFVMGPIVPASPMTVVIILLFAILMILISISQSHQR